MSSNSTQPSQLQLQAIRQRNDPQQPKQRRQVLSEEAYTSTLSRIVQRDFFPALTNLQEQSTLLSQRNHYHPHTLARKLHQLQAKHEQEELEKAKQEEESQIELHQDGENEASANGSTELVVADQESGQLIRATARPLHEETLTGFHARATNEDDDEFDKQQKREVQANRQRLESLFLLGRNPNDDATKRLTNGDDFRITSDSTAEDMVNALRKAEQNRIQAAKDESHMASDQFESEPYQPTHHPVPPIRNGLFLPPTPQVHGPRNGNSQTSQQLLTNGENRNGSANQSNLQLAMPPPLPVRKQDTTQQNNTQSSLPKTLLVEYIPKYCLEKKIVPSQTRFPPVRVLPPNADQQTRLFGQTSSALSRYTRGRRPHESDSESDGWSTDASTDLDAPLRPVEIERRIQQAKRVKEHGTYVNMTPVIEPGSGRHRSPITTWGTVAFTPIVVSGSEHIVEVAAEESSNDMTNAYKMAEESGREVAARKAEEDLERRAKRAKTTKKSGKLSSSSSHSKSNKRSNSTLSTAASRFMASRSGSSSRQRDAFASAIRGSYTPKRQSSLLSSSSSTSSKRSKEGSVSGSKRGRTRDHAHNATPLASRSIK
ncbi:unnamed protein product [Cylindrotheca closterium]|uniref:Uncharacterized protein n=1 Tax=Cylindrotheca closterium TaxID=2856 RepID=A0AAD2G9L1_9STRA|nr:unnamed protein product [Cylindrotheca closterium]